MCGDLEKQRNTMERELSSKWKIFVLSVLVSLVSICYSKAENALISEFKTIQLPVDTIPVLYYACKPEYLRNIIAIVLDSVNKHFNCNEIEYVFVKHDSINGHKILSLQDIGIYPQRNLPPPQKDTLACLTINNTLVFMRLADFYMFEFCSINELQNPKYEEIIHSGLVKYRCLEAEVEGNMYSVMMWFSFSLEEMENPELIHHSFLINSGDIGFHRQSFFFRFRIVRWFMRVFKL